MASAATVFAQASPASVHLTEQYTYNQEISRNESMARGGEHSGAIEVLVPYDGYQHFTRQAFTEVKRSLKDAGDHPLQSVIGYLALADWARKGVDAELTELLSEHHGSIPLAIPIAGDGITSELDLTRDEHAAQIGYSYSPPWPDVFPIRVSLKLEDEETSSAPARGQESDAHVDPQTDSLPETHFRRGLLLSVGVSVRLPRPHHVERPAPRIVSVADDWPTMTSIGALTLSVGGQAASPLTYNPIAQALEWGDVQMEASEVPIQDFVQWFASPRITLSIDQVGELFQQASLTVHVEVEVPDYLFSGIEARLYDARGVRHTGVGLSLATRLRTDVHLNLDEAFSLRSLSPRQEWFFDGIIPDEARIVDIKGAFEDRGFNVGSGVQTDRGTERLHYVTTASRAEGPETLKLAILVNGKRYTTQRQTQVPGGQTFTSQVESGELRINVSGDFRGQSGVVVREMNALRAALGDRFERLRARR